MIDGSRIRFGYGDVAVGSTLFCGLKMQQFIPPQEIGTNVHGEAVEWVGPIIVIGSQYEDLAVILDKLTLVEMGKIREFHSCGYIFDFNNYNQRSVDVVRKHAKRALEFAIMPFAC